MRILFISIAVLGGIVAASAAQGESAVARRAEVQSAFEAAERE